MNKRQKQKAETREKILEIARSLFSRKGFEVSMRFLANEAGISVGSLFVHFKDKHDRVFVLQEEKEKERIWNELLDQSHVRRYFEK